MPDAPSRLSDYPFVIVRVGCHFCPRHGAYRLARLAAKYGPEIDLWDLLDALAADCRWHHAPGERRPGKYEAKCGAFFPDLGRPVPPDLPPAMRQLRIVQGGKGDRFSEERRRKQWERGSLKKLGDKLCS